jgi:hypothetical protein
VVAYQAWLGAGALTIGMGAVALACSGAATADTGASACHTISASHSSAAHTAPRLKPAAALIAASIAAGAANHKPILAAAVNHSAATSLAHPTASAVPNIVKDLAPLVGSLVHLGSAITNFNAVYAVHAAFGPLRNAIQTVGNAVHIVFADIQNVVAGIAYYVTIPFELPFFILEFLALKNAGLWF